MHMQNVLINDILCLVFHIYLSESSSLPISRLNSLIEKAKAAVHDGLDLKYELILISFPFDCISLINQLKTLTAFSSKHLLN